MIENRDNSINMNYGLPAVVSANFKYTPQNSYFGIKLKYQNINANVKGVNWQNAINQTIFGSYFEGRIVNSTYIFQLEHLNDNSKLNFGYNFGIGQTSETIRFDYNQVNKIENDFMVFNFGGVLKYSINKNLNVNFETYLLWNDPINSVAGKYVNLAGDDINLLFEFCVSYKLN